VISVNFILSVTDAYNKYLKYSKMPPNVIPLQELATILKHENPIFFTNYGQANIVYLKCDKY